MSPGERGHALREIPSAARIDSLTALGRAHPLVLSHATCQDTNELTNKSEFVAHNMRFGPTGLLRSLGVRRAIQLVTHLPSFVKLFSRLVKDSRVGLGPKLVLVGILAYVIFPVDLVPDFILGFGQVDDLIVIFLGLKLFLRLCPKGVVHEHLQSIAAGR